jgi:hypothetical protein
MTDDQVLEVQDQWDRTILMTADVWSHHICTAHPELEGHMLSVRHTLSSPDIVCFDAGRSDAECFYKVGAIAAVPYRFLKVAVRFPEYGQVGFVHTAYISRNIPPKERPKWLKS